MRKEIKMADFNKVAPHFPAWDVIDYRGLDIGLVTNFEGEGLVATIKADFTDDKPRTIKATLTETRDEFFEGVNEFICHLMIEKGN